MINIDDRFYIDTDPLNYILKVRRTKQKGKNEGQEAIIELGYYNTLDNALEGYIELKEKEAVSEGMLTVQEAIEAIRQSHNAAVEVIRSHAGRFRHTDDKTLA
jgi:hypothetical protein